MSQLSNNKYDLEERTARFGEEVILLCKTIVQTPISKSIILQLIRSATSVGANYMEANGACSKRDFVNKIYICKKETQETKHWFRMLKSACPEKSAQIDCLFKECQELTLIFQKITLTIKNGKA